MAYVVVSRMASMKARDAMESSTTGFELRGLRLFARADCTDANLCQKPVGGNMGTIIGISVAIPFVVGVVVLFFLHRRMVRRQRLEDMRDPHKSLDFGLGETGGGAKEPPLQRQMSMDMNLTSPYLLPPEMQQSRGSLGSLARAMHHNEDPYRHVPSLAASDAMSTKSERSKSALSGTTYGRESSRMGSRSATLDTVTTTSTGRKSSLPSKSLLSPVLVESPVSPPTPVYNQAFSPRLVNPVMPDILDMGPAPQELIMPTTIQELAPATMQIPRKPPPMHQDLADSAIESEQPTVGISPLDGELLLAGPPRHEVASTVAFPMVEEAQAYTDYAWMPQVAAVEHEYEHLDEARGRNMDRLSHVYEQDARGGALNLPPANNRRLSVGFRPLPPDDIMESGDPEYRANRIRSFYKEYFEDGSRREPMPPMPDASYGGYDGQGGYLEDYDANYAGHAAYFDPDTNAFVMPYAQPVARRAMTPPPSGQRFPRQRCPPRRPNGNGQRTHRSGSASSSPLGPTAGGFSRPGSSASSYMPGRPRAGSTMSGGRFGPRKPMPPPEHLTTLPTPSKLRDDSFALMGATNFAPPDTFAERAAGRSQSPSGESRPYKLNVPVSSPLVTPFMDLPDLPSPHKLRLSNTFTALDFAPPPKFGDADDSRSETGSIRSNRSGISAKNLGAIRSGAGRVSRLPGDHVFTQAAMAEQLKPQWGMRP